MPAVLEERVLGELVALAVRNTPMSLAASVLNGCAMAYVVSGFLPRAEVLSWLGALCALTAVRGAVTLAYHRSDHGPVDAARWRYVFSAGTLANGAIWGLAGALFFSIEYPGVRAFVALIIAGMVAGGVSTIAPLRGTALAWVALLVLPVTWNSFLLGGSLWPLFGLTTVLFIATEAGAVFTAHERIVASVRLALENAVLVETLSRSKYDLESTNVELAHTRDLAVTAARAKADFLANMSHEIRTPMTSILGYADLVQDDPQGPDVGANLAVIQRNASHLLAIINDILDFSKIDAGKLDVEKVAFCPGEVIGSTVAMLEHRAREAKIELRCELTPPFPREVVSDPVRLRQILLNLLSNAIKFTPSGSVSVEGVAQQMGERARMSVRVRDTGIGMSPGQVERLFRPFTQADRATATKFGGTGLGLSISKRLSELLGGELSVQSEPGVGSCFSFSIDIGLWSELLAAPPERRLRPAMRARHQTPKFEGRVLLAEDGLDNQRLIRTLLERRGLQVELAVNGIEAVDLALRAQQEGDPFDVVLMDVQMPEMDGMTAARLLKQHGLCSPIVALTAQALSGDRESCLRAGFDGYETKPIDPRRFDRTLAAYLNRKPPAS
jgi:signal transduction histidine kinase/ActR/RegA family two-component response regulator